MTAIKHNYYDKHHQEMKSVFDMRWDSKQNQFIRWLFCIMIYFYNAFFGRNQFLQIDSIQNYHNL